MFSLPGYAIYEKIHENDNIKVYRGYTISERKPVIIKALKKKAANLLAKSKLLHEYEITRNLYINGVIRPIKLEQVDLSLALVTEDTGAVSLRKYLSNNPVTLPDFLKIAVQLAEILSSIHKEGIIHGDLKPENILIHPDTGKVYIIDFSCAVQFPAGSKNFATSHIPSGTLEYMSPEQTGRLEAEVDQRSDLYSLGVVLYEIITSQLPLQAENLAGWVHAHISRNPQPPDKIKTGIPSVISEIIMKLLEKAAGERYQSAYGLLWDLRKCERLFLQPGEVKPFKIGQMDAFSCFSLPRKLYGREKEKEILKEAFDRVSHGRSETVLISGYPGMGKTSLVNEGLKPYVLDKGYFITGKFDQLKKNIPYAPFADAFGSLIRQLMTESQEELKRWAKRISRALARREAVITGIIPELEYIIGKPLPVDPLPPREAENRFLMVFRDFVRVFARKGCPLVLFLDDLQWADPACLKLINYLTEDTGLNYLLFVGAFRRNEIDREHPLMEMLQGIHNEHDGRQLVPLFPLEWGKVEEMVAETLHNEPGKVSGLSEALYRRSGGNPFFLKQLMKTMYDEGFLYFDMEEDCWRWDLQAFQEQQPEEDVLELLVRKLQRLPKETREVLKLAACIGNRFDLGLMAAVCGKSVDTIASGLKPAIFEGLVLKVENRKTSLHPEKEEEEHTEFEFVHDRIQQAAYSLIPESGRKERHLAIGRLLLKTAGQEGLEDKILEIMDHFNRSIDLIGKAEERLELAEYNLIAGRKAKANAAYVSALQYFRTGMELLPETAWKDSYKLCYDLHLELAQAECLSANMDAAEKLFDTVIENCGTESERAGIYGLKVILFAGLGKYNEAVGTTIRALARLGVRIPLHPAKWDYIRELFLYKLYMRERKIESLLNLPEMEDPVKIKTAELLSRLCSVTMTSHPDLHGFIILKTGNFAARYGNSEMSPIGYIGYSLTIGNVLGDYESGDRYGRISIELAEKYGKSSCKCIIYFVYGALIVHWTKHASCAPEYLRKAAQSGLEAGDVLIVGYAHCLLLELKYLLGAPLGEIYGEIREKSEMAKRLKHENLAINAAIYDRVVSALSGRAADTLAEGIKAFEDEKFLEFVSRDKTSLATYYYYKLKLNYMAGNYKDALEAARKVEPISNAILGFLASAEYNFYYSLAIIAHFKDMTLKERRLYLKKLKKNQRRMKKWSGCCGENFEHKYLLVAAEIAGLRNRKEEAMILYDRAIKLARENGYIRNETLACELAAKFYLRQNMMKIARAYMQDACLGYNRWGAYAKEKDLRSRYSGLLEDAGYGNWMAEAAAAMNVESISTPSDSEIANGMYMYFIDRIVENMSKETDLEKLLESFLDLAVQSVGANNGYLILEKDGELFIEAAKDVNSDEAVVKTVPLEESSSLSKAVVRYVARTLETVVLNSGEQAGVFAADPYIAESNPGSIVCLPLLLQGIPFGVLYFENSFIPGVFAQDRLEYLKLLSTQVACVKALQSYLEKSDKKDEDAEHPVFIEPLTDRETDVLKLIAEGMSNKEIADRLNITINTVKGHIKNIYEKLGVNRRVQVVTRAKELNILKNL